MPTTRRGSKSSPLPSSPTQLTQSDSLAAGSQTQYETTTSTTASAIEIHASTETDVESRTCGSHDVTGPHTTAQQVTEAEPHLPKGTRKPGKRRSGKRKSGKRGPYAPRKAKDWPLHFKTRQPRPTEDDSIAVPFEESHRPAPKTFVSSNVTVPDEVIERELELHDLDEASSDSAAEDPEINTNMLSQKWQLDTPPMEYIYLQDAFPYEGYKPSKNRVVTESLQSLPDPLPSTWYRPQGQLPQEDLFSMKKYSYASEMLKKINVETDDMRMDVYFQRGFDMAAKRVLDRIRAENRKARQSSEAEGALSGVSEMEATGAPQTTHSESSLPSSSVSQQSSSAPTELNQRSEQPLTSTSEAHPSLFSLSNRGDHEDQSDERGSGMSSVRADRDGTDGGEKASTEALASRLEASKRMDPNSEITLADYYQVNMYLSALFQQPHTVKSYAETPLGPGACRILQTVLANLETKILGMGCHLQRAELTRRLAKVDVVRKRKSMVDAVGHQYKRLKKVDKDEFIFKVCDKGRRGAKGDEHGKADGERREESEEEDSEEEERGGGSRRDQQNTQDGGHEGASQEGAEASRGPQGVGLPFVSNPLRIPECMDPFLVARDYMQNNT
ncbi:hypothetical protein BGX31_011348 [Mortierella sp. GBA43]|nr:hypothetical protein BGX31_011348 [Mortierella sp. GBA43]